MSHAMAQIVPYWWEFIRYKDLKGVKKKKTKQQKQQQEHQGPLAFTKPQYFSFWATFLRKPFRKETISRSKDPKV